MDGDKTPGLCGFIIAFKDFGRYHFIIPWGFYEKQKILNEILVANECVVLIRACGMVELEKSYDFVKQEFLDYALSQKGFGNR